MWIAFIVRLPVWFFLYFNHDQPLKGDDKMQHKDDVGMDGKGDGKLQSSLKIHNKRIKQERENQYEYNAN